MIYVDGAVVRRKHLYFPFLSSSVCGGEEVRFGVGTKHTLRRNEIRAAMDAATGRRAGDAVIYFVYIFCLVQHNVRLLAKWARYVPEVSFLHISYFL